MNTIKAVFFDADGTLLTIENPYFSIARELGCEDESKRLVRRYLAGEMTYQRLTEEESSLFVTNFKQKFSREPMRGDFERMLPPVTIRVGVRELIRAIQEAGREVFVLSSGVIDMVHQLTDVGIPVDHLFANRFLYDSSGKYVKREIVVSGEKLDAFSRIISRWKISVAQVCYIADNSFDRALFDFVGDRGGLAILFDTGERKEFRLEVHPADHHIFIARNVSDISKIILSRS